MTSTVVATEQDLEAMEGSPVSLPPWQVELVPPDEPGGKGFTLEDLDWES